MDKLMLDCLSEFYNRLDENIKKKKKKLERNSVLLTFLNFKSNDRYRLLSNSSIPSYKINKAVIPLLEKEKLIRETESIGEYTLTAMGLWEVEKEKELLHDMVIIDYFDEKFFNLYKKIEKPLSDKQKVILLSFIATRAFSDHSVIDLKTTDKRLDKLQEIINNSYHLLKSLGMITKLKFNDLYRAKGKGNERPVSHLIRHTDALPKITKGLYKAKGNQKYFLDLYRENRFSEKDLIFLFKKIFDFKNLNYNELEKLYKFCIDTAHNYNIFLFDIDRHIFSKSKFDRLIKDILFIKI